MRPILIAIVFAILAAASARAEPGPVVNWLMTTPTSRFDFGMDRLRRYVQSYKGDHPLSRLVKGVHYDWAENRIMIFLDERRTAYDAERCADLLEALREAGGIWDGKYGVPSIMDTYGSLYARKFGSEVKIASQPENYRPKIDKIIRVNVFMDGGSCEGKLLSTEVLHKTE